MTPFAQDEAARVAEVRSYNIVGTPPEPDYDEIAEMAAHVTSCPGGLINILDDKTLWSKSRYGVPNRSEPLPRELFMCSTAALGSGLLEVPDCSRDERFAQMPVVKGEPFVRFYAGMPLINYQGYHLGSLCVVDFAPREKLTLEQREAMRCLSHHVVTMLELRRKLIELEQARQEASAEREKAERLLHNILPASVARELKERNQVAPRFFDSASILFADFQHFTQLAERLEPRVLIDQLNDFFSGFDVIAERNRLEMLKTIGDAYMCVGGVPEANRTNPVDACLAALQMRSEMELVNRRRERLNLPRWDVRIGIHTGPVIAGIVGRRKFIYDIWGDAVNIAARMEAAGEAGRVNVSAEVYERTRLFFDFEPRGSLAAKNKGKIDMFFLLGLKPEFARDQERCVPNASFAAQCEGFFTGYVPAR
ncbi:adenylate/guanylate cyclase domain-containing protein [Bradyrhizobium sp. DASA03007]|uniref:adenylate/guanylate cyclase domain-containing protein n=1 Tax=unclassified Bradyrhizobium TaxID=2631580 RepID=UPI003F71F11F